MPRFDYKCPRCGVEKEIVLSQPDADRHAQVFCSACAEDDDDFATLSVMERLPAAPSFYITGFNARNGYSNSK